MKLAFFLLIGISNWSFGQLAYLKEWIGNYEGILYFEFTDKRLYANDYGFPSNERSLSLKTGCTLQE
jgi:hypothetical protein